MTAEFYEAATHGPLSVLAKQRKRLVRVVVHRGTRFFIKAVWDTWIHTTRLERNLRSLLVPRSGALYFGNTLWCSYSLKDYQPCGYGFGPLQAGGAKKVECPKLPHGRGAIGPYPYAAGLRLEADA